MALDENKAPKDWCATGLEKPFLSPPANDGEHRIRDGGLLRTFLRHWPDQLLSPLLRVCTRMGKRDCGCAPIIKRISARTCKRRRGLHKVSVIKTEQRRSPQLQKPFHMAAGGKDDAPESKLSTRAMEQMRRHPSAAMPTGCREEASVPGKQCTPKLQSAKRRC